MIGRWTGLPYIFAVVGMTLYSIWQSYSIATEANYGSSSSRQTNRLKIFSSDSNQEQQQQQPPPLHHSSSTSVAAQNPRGRSPRDALLRSSVTRDNSSSSTSNAQSLPAEQQAERIIRLDDPPGTVPYQPWEILPSLANSDGTLIRAAPPLSGTTTDSSGSDAAAGTATDKTVVDYCQPLPGIPMTCCPGSISADGEVHYKPDECFLSDRFARVRSDALAYLQTLPKPSSPSSSPVETVGDGGAASACDDVCRIFHLLLQNNWTLSLSGDSIMRQTFQGLMCEIYRRSGGGEAPEQVAAPPKQWYRVVSHTESGWPDRDPEEAWRVGVRETINVTFADASLSSAATIIFYGQYRHRLGNHSEMQHILKHSDILIFDHSLHYEGEQLLNAMTDLFQALFNSSRNSGDADVDRSTEGKQTKLVAWREATAQHFNADNGYFPGNVPGFGLSDCRAASETTTTDAHFRVPILQQACANLGVAFVDAFDPAFSSPPSAPAATGETPPSSFPSQRQELIMLPFFDFTRQLHYMHGTSECTHFCHSSYLWLPVWRGLRLAMDRLVSQQPNSQGYS
jgi:hypothetical protein